jgi:hypothetical protein
MGLANSKAALIYRAPTGHPGGKLLGRVRAVNCNERHQRGTGFDEQLPLMPTSKGNITGTGADEQWN